MVLLGPQRESYFRVVTPERDRNARRLLGYWATLELAHDAALALFERVSGMAIEGAGRPAQRQVPPQKPPPVRDETGVAAPVARARQRLVEAAAAPRR